MSTHWTGKRVVVTGGAGFLGSFLVEKLWARGAADIVVPRRREFDLSQAPAAARLYAQARPDVLFHLAACVGGIGANRTNPGRFFYENMAMGLNIVEEARRYGRLEKLVLVGTTCSYPKFAPPPFREETLWDGYPEETNAPYGVAKRALLVMAQAYRQQYGLNSVCVIPANLYGPRDNFDLQTSHVIPALLRKFEEARQAGAASATVWGSGQVSREFLYVEDAAEGLLLAGERCDDPEPVNLGTGAEITIRDLAETIREIVGYRGEIVWDRSQPDGQPRRQLDTESAWKKFGFRAPTDLRTGLRQTLAWYRENYAAALVASRQVRR